MKEGWKCPNCGKAHAPHVQTCPENATLPPFGAWPLYVYPPTFYDPPMRWPYEVTCGDPPGTVGVSSTQVYDSVSGESFGHSV